MAPDRLDARRGRRRRVRRHARSRSDSGRMHRMTSTLSPPAAASAERPRKVSLSYLPGLDGLRAISVIAVLLYNSRDVGIDWLPEGGFLGVEVFFVISGYLITALLLAEYRNRAAATGQGRIDLKTFWTRRARRLLPALYLLLATVS